MQENNISFDVRKRATWKFILFMVISFDFYLFVWLWKFIKDFNKIEENIKNKINYWRYAIPLFVLNVFDLYYTIKNWNSDEFLTPTDIKFLQAWATLYIIMCMILVQHIGKFALKQYKTELKCNKILLFLFTFTYLNFVINSFEKRIKRVQNH